MELPVDQKKHEQDAFASKIKSLVSGTEASGAISKPVKIKGTRKKREPKIGKDVSAAVNQNEEAIANPQHTAVTGRLNEKFIAVLDELASFMTKRGEHFKAKAYQTAQETLILYPRELTSQNYRQIEPERGIGKTIMQKFTEYVNTGDLAVLKREREDPQNVFAEIYGVGPKKAKDLVEKGIRTLDELKERQGELLNAVQRTGIKYYDDILQRIPRQEIDEYAKAFNKAFTHSLAKTTAQSAHFEIVGSYRRGAQASGDIDVIVTSQNNEIFKHFIDRLIETDLIVEVLSRGQTKSLVIGKLPEAVHARRIDFLFSNPEEYPFAVLYFTGSKIFNTVMRGRALQMGYSLNEHGMYAMEGKKKGAKVSHRFEDERDIFAFLKMEYKAPEERTDGRAVVALSGSPKVDMSTVLHLPPVPALDSPAKEAVLHEPVDEVVQPKKKTVTRKNRQTKEEKEATKALEKITKVEAKALEKAAKEEAKALEKAAKAQAKALEKASKQSTTRKQRKANETEPKETGSKEAEEVVVPVEPEVIIEAPLAKPTKQSATRKVRKTKEEKEAEKAAKAIAKAEAKAAKQKTRKVSPTTAPVQENEIKISPKIKQMRGPKTKKNIVPEPVLEPMPRPGPGPVTMNEHVVCATSLENSIQGSSSDPILHSLQHFKTHGIHVLHALSEDTLRDMLLYANDAFHSPECGRILVLTDNEYDILKEYIEHKYPKNAVLSKIGAPTHAKNKVALPYEMASMDKIKPDTGILQTWKSKYTGPYVLSCKLDGVSGMYSTEGPVPKLYTRGDGKVGQDISHFIPYLRLPDVGPGVVVRGEFIIAKATFRSKYADTFANARNLVAGTINRITIDDKLRDIDFVVYEMIKPANLVPSEQMRQIRDRGFATVQNETLTEISNDVLSERLVDWRTNYAYEIDGVIVSNDRVYPRASGNPDHAFAFKMVLTEQMAESKVLEVLWTASKDGYLKPRVKIEPVHLSGVKIEYATGFNGAFIEANRIGMGAMIQVIRSGDVIPHIRAVTVPAERAQMPTEPYRWNDSHVDVMLEDVDSSETVRKAVLVRFFTGLKVDGLGEGNVSKMMAAGYDTIPKILRMSTDDFLTIGGFEKKMATKLHDGIAKQVAAASLLDLMAVSNTFGRGFSSAKLALIMEHEPAVLTSAEPLPEKVKRIAAIKGMASKTAAAFVEHIPTFLGFLEDCGLADRLQTGSSDQSSETAATGAKHPVDTTHPLYKKTIVMSGSRDKALESDLKRVGAVLGSSVSSKTFAVVTPDKDGTTGKVATAREVGVAIYTPEEFKAQYLSA